MMNKIHQTWHAQWATCLPNDHNRQSKQQEAAYPIWITMMIQVRMLGSTGCLGFLRACYEHKLPGI